MSYQIVCTTQEPANEPHDHARIIEVGIGDEGGGASSQMTLAQVLNSIDAGQQFFTKGRESGFVAKVHPFTCLRCNRRWIKSSPDAVRDNNLDFLRVCTWKS